jgi:hypothetical protein
MTGFFKFVFTMFASFCVGWTLTDVYQIATYGPPTYGTPPAASEYFLVGKVLGGPEQWTQVPAGGDLHWHVVGIFDAAGLESFLSGEGSDINPLSLLIAPLGVNSATDAGPQSTGLTLEEFNQIQEQLKALEGDKTTVTPDRET